MPGYIDGEPYGNFGYDDGSDQFNQWVTDTYGGAPPSGYENGADDFYAWLTGQNTPPSGYENGAGDFNNWLQNDYAYSGGLDPFDPRSGMDPHAPGMVDPNGSNFWSTLGNAAKNFLGGGESGGGSRGLGNAAQVAGTAAQAAAQGRLAEAMYLIGRDRNALDFYKAKTAAPNLFANQAVRGSLLQNAQDSQTTHPRANVVNFGGGAKPSMLTPQARAMGGTMVTNAVANNQSLGTTPFPQMSREPQPGFFESVNSGLGNGLGLANAGMDIWSWLQKALANNNGQ